MKKRKAFSKNYLNVKNNDYKQSNKDSCKKEKPVN